MATSACWRGVAAWPMAQELTSVVSPLGWAPPAPAVALDAVVPAPPIPPPVDMSPPAPVVPLPLPLALELSLGGIAHASAQFVAKHASYACFCGFAVHPGPGTNALRQSTQVGSSAHAFDSVQQLASEQDWQAGFAALSPQAGALQKPASAHSDGHPVSQTQLKIAS